jgi:hypothetical protein
MYHGTSEFTKELASPGYPQSDHLFSVFHWRGPVFREGCGLSCVTRLLSAEVPSVWRVLDHTSPAQPSGSEGIMCLFLLSQ